MRNFDDLSKLCDILLGPDGCPWDKEQTIESLKKYILEESEEVAHAIDLKDWKNLKEELGDVLYNIIFIAKLAEKSQKFDINQIIDEIYKKLVRRHPHIFGDKKLKTSEEVKKAWQEIKKEEKKAPESSL
jgi:tetrapyrrole methylase family protein / MazG family protein